MFHEDEYIFDILYPTDNFFLQAECYHYLFDAAIKLHQMGLDWSTPNHGPIRSSRGLLGGHQNENMSAKAGSLISNNGIVPSRVSC